MKLRAVAMAGLTASLFAGAFSSQPAFAQSNDYATDCPALIAQVEARRNIPRGLLMAIAVTESAINGRPNPYAMNIAGKAYHANGVQDMANVIQSNWSRGVKSIDVGCMQVNLKYHGHKFARLTDLLHSPTNVEYGASYLISLATETGSWKEAVMNYHNRNNPSRRAWYGCKVWNNYLRISMAQTGFIPCGKTPSGSSTASIGSTKPIQIAGYNAAAQSPGPLAPPAYARGAVRSTRNLGDIDNHGRTNQGRVKGSITIVGADKSIPDVLNDDARSSAFRAVQPVDWSNRARAESNRPTYDLTQPASGSQTGFGRVLLSD